MLMCLGSRVFGFQTSDANALTPNKTSFIRPYQVGKPVLFCTPKLTDLYYRGTSFIRNTPPACPYSSPMPGGLW